MNAVEQISQTGKTLAVAFKLFNFSTTKQKNINRDRIALHAYQSGLYV